MIAANCGGGNYLFMILFFELCKEKRTQYRGLMNSFLLLVYYVLRSILNPFCGAISLLLYLVIFIACGSAVIVAQAGSAGYSIVIH